MKSKLKLKKSVTLFTLIFLSAGLLLSAPKKPGWVKKRPIIRGYYIGIGIAEKSKENQDHLRQAKNNALNELASEITINISSKITDKITIQSGLSESEFKSEIQSTTKSTLEDFELIDTWEDKKEYWVYYRLSISKYKEAKRLRLERAINLSKDLLRKAKREESGNNPASALIYYKQAFDPIRNHITETLKTDYEGSEIFLRNEIYVSLQSLLGKIELKPEKGALSAKVGKPLNEPYLIHAVYRDDNGVEHNAFNLPLKLSFIRGSGDMIEQLFTDANGVAKGSVSKITSTDRLQIIKSEIDLLIPADNDTASSRIVSKILRSLSIPGPNVILNVSGLSVFLESSELNLGKPLEIQSITAKFKNWLTGRGFTFVDEISEADLAVRFKVETREGNTTYGQFVAYADMEISVIDLTSGEESYSNALSNVKGIQLNYEKAGLKALENTFKKMSETILPEFITTVQR